jgi:hypothetical protein
MIKKINSITFSTSETEIMAKYEITLKYELSIVFITDVTTFIIAHKI